MTCNFIYYLQDNQSEVPKKGPGNQKIPGIGKADGGSLGGAQKGTEGHIKGMHW